MGELFSDFNPEEPGNPITKPEEMKKGQAAKFDNGKPRMELLPPNALEGIAKIFTFGAKKYHEWNFKSGDGLEHLRVLGACYRHLNAWNNGEDLDQESGESHLYHAGCCIMMLIDLVDSGIGSDGRFKGRHHKNEDKG